MKWKSFYAFANLAYHFWAHLFRRLIGKKSPGLKEFLSFYADDHIVALTCEDKAELYAFSRCLQCGLCDSVCFGGSTARRRTVLDPSFLAGTLTRSMVDFGAIDTDYAFCEGCRGCESICPTAVPIRKAIGFIARKKQEQHAAQASPLPAPTA